MKLSVRHIAPLLLWAMIPAGASAHDQTPGSPAAAQCLGLPVDKIAIATYVFAGPLAGVAIPAEWDQLPVGEKFKQLKPFGAKLLNAKPDRSQIAAMFREISAIGYRNIEGMDLISEGAPEVYDQLLKESGLNAVSGHVVLDKATWPAALAAAKARGQKSIGSGGFGQPGFATLDDVRATARNLNEMGKDAAAEGLVFHVHNHTGEFDARFPYDHGDGKPVMTSAWEIVAAETDPRYVHFEVDIFWARLAFKPEKSDELLTFLRKYRERIVLLHMKDFAPNGAVADLGKGTTDWRSIVEAAGPQIAYYVFEHDFPSDPVKAAKTGFEFLSCGAAPR